TCIIQLAITAESTKRPSHPPMQFANMLPDSLLWFSLRRYLALSFGVKIIKEFSFHTDTVNSPLWVSHNHAKMHFCTKI
ncbi:hypothetical protein, partial [Raoultella ornithinolytica]|uniref:hypothetical protein n=1 Tax=Raoultella ornithinolytica TaxID=54291 RepID=UPI00195E8B67